jgi:PadR family transcriptional regulator, regulatory protein PadR
MKLRRSTRTLQVLAEFLERPREWKYGYDISRSTGLKSGTLYPILMRLAGHDLLETHWETADPGKPPRHMYRLTSSGLQHAREVVPSRSKLLQTQPAFGGARNS